MWCVPPRPFTGTASQPRIFRVRPNLPGQSRDKGAVFPFFVRLCVYWASLLSRGTKLDGEPGEPRRRDADCSWSARRSPLQGRTGSILQPEENVILDRQPQRTRFTLPVDHGRLVSSTSTWRQLGRARLPRFCRRITRAMYAALRRIYRHD